MLKSIAPEIQVAIFRAICRFRPVGMHMHFRVISITRQVNSTMGTSLTCTAILKFVLEQYNVDQVLAQEQEQHDFELPWEDYAELIEQHRRADVASEGTPERTPDQSPIKRKRKPSKRKR